MSDLIERLRNQVPILGGIAKEAADALEAKDREIIELQARIDGYHLVEGRMTKLIAELESALREIADYKNVSRHHGIKAIAKQALKEQDDA